jgi:hypothetical protein
MCTSEISFLSPYRFVPDGMFWLIQIPFSRRRIAAISKLAVVSLAPRAKTGATRILAARIAMPTATFDRCF